MVHPRKILTPEFRGNEKFYYCKIFLFLISATFWKNECSATQVQTAPKNFRLVVNSVMSTNIKNMFRFFGRFFLEFLTSSNQQCYVYIECPIFQQPMPPSETKGSLVFLLSKLQNIASNAQDTVPYSLGITLV